MQVVEEAEVWNSAMAQVEKEGTHLPNSLTQVASRRHRHKHELDH